MPYRSAMRYAASATLAVVLATIATLSPAAAQDNAKPMIVGSDFGVAPWMVRGTSGPEGFGVDLIETIAKRLGRPVEIKDINFSGLFAALLSSRIDFTVNPLNITQERAERMLYTEPFFATGNGFLVKADTEMKGFEDLSGQAIAVNRGTISDTWATENADKYGFTVQRYETFPDTVQAVLTNRAFAALNEIPTTVYAASKNSRIKVGFKDFNGRNFGYAFRYESEKERDQVEAVIECLKTDGTMTKLYEKWYGETPEKDSPLTTVYPGYGAPDFKGYDATPHEASCS